MDFIGRKLEDVINFLKEQNKSFEIINNNYNVTGDTLLVTNVKEQNQKVIIYVGEFVFNLKGEIDER